jgi:hypothetical protein
MGSCAAWHSDACVGSEALCTAAGSFGCRCGTSNQKNYCQPKFLQAAFIVPLTKLIINFHHQHHPEVVVIEAGTPGHLPKSCSEMRRSRLNKRHILGRLRAGCQHPVGQVFVQPWALPALQFRAALCPYVAAGFSSWALPVSCLLLCPHACLLGFHHVRVLHVSNCPTFIQQPLQQICSCHDPPSGH